MLVGLLLLMLAVALPLVVRWASGLGDSGPAVEIAWADGTTRRVGLADIRRHPQVVRRGEAQNQYGNWRDAGTYTGVLLTDLLRGSDYVEIEVRAIDGYQMAVERSRVEDPAFPMVLAYALDGISVPDWEDGFRLVVLPEGGRVSNEAYRTVSAGSYWVKNVERITLRAAATTESGSAPPPADPSR